MVRLTSWFRSQEREADTSGPSTSTSTPTQTQTPKADLWAAEISNLEDAFSAADLIIDGDMDAAQSRLESSPASSYHQLALAVITFIRSILGFEKEVMALASAQLADCEARALADQRRVQKEFAECVGKGGKCGAHPPGTEYALVNAEAMLMGAVVGVLHESLAEGIKSFYKLRKAYFALEAIVQLDVKGDIPTREPAGSFTDRMPGTFEDEQDSESESLPNEQTKTQPPESASSTPRSSGPPTPPSGTSSPATPGDADLTNPRDIFIRSGTSLCFGTLLFLFTLVPPALSKLMSIVGFRGDRERGIRMLWASSASANVHGAIAAVVLLSYYNGLLGLADILPPADLFDEDAEIVGPPVKKCEELLREMRRRYPNSGFWELEESKMLANERRLGDALGVLRGMPPSNMRQVDALCAFEMALDAMFAMDWVLMRDSFLRCVEMNEWSRTLYYFLAGCAEVEMYRDAVQSKDLKKAKERKKAAEELFAKAPSAAGKKRLLAKQLPFEVFVLRKLRKWGEATGEGSIVDAVGLSPAQEMVYLWNGGRRLDKEQAERALGYLEWGRCTAGKADEKEVRSVDEEGARGVCRAALLRVLGRIDEARVELEGVLAHDRSCFKGPTKEDYVLPCTHYEMGALAWTEAINAGSDSLPDLDSMDQEEARGSEAGGQGTAEKERQAIGERKVDGESGTDGESKPEAQNEPGGQSEAEIQSGEGSKRKGDDSLDEYRKEKIEECQASLDRAAGWEAFVLDARCGMRVQTGVETLRWYRRRMGWV